MSLRSFLVTGAGGFVGAVLCRRLVQLGHEVHAVMRSDRPGWRLSDVGDRLRLHRADLRDQAAVSRVVSESRPDVVYHLATHGAYATQTDADAIIQTNILGTWNLLKALGRTNYSAFVNTGSSSEYGFKTYAMRETDLLEPNSYYAVAKCAQTLLGQHIATTEDRPITTFRLFSVYGPYEEPSRLVPTTIRRCLAGEDLTLVSPAVARDFVYVDDVVDAYLRLDEIQKLRGETINIGTGVQSTVREVVDHVVAHTKASVRCLWGEMPGRTWDSTTWVADCSKARRLLGWQARTSLSEGLRQTVDWARAHPGP